MWMRPSRELDEDGNCRDGTREPWVFEEGLGEAKKLWLGRDRVQERVMAWEPGDQGTGWEAER